MSFLNFFQRQKAKTSHPTALLKTGRIIEGNVLDVKTDARGYITRFYSDMSRREYESSRSWTRPRSRQ